MTYLRSFTISATAALLLIAVGGCSDDEGDDPPSTAPSATSNSSSSPATPSGSGTPTESELATDAATAVVHRYFAVLDGVRQQPGKALRALSTVATSSQLAAQQRLVREERGKGLHQVGTTRIGDLTVQSVNLDNSKPSAGKAPTVTIDVCWDVGNADLVDKSGKSVVAPSHPATGWTRYTVANYHWATDKTNGWRIATSQDLKMSPCAAS